MAANVTPNLADKLSGYENQSGLHALLEAICARLRTQDLFAAKGLRVLPEYDGDLINSLVAVLNKRLSVFASVSFSVCNANQASLSAMLKDIHIEVEVYESVLMNQGASGTKTSALTFAEAALASLHQWSPEQTATLRNPQPLRMQQTGTLQMDKEKSDLKGGLVCYVARLVTSQCLACHCS
ncbi:hypothetical protein [Prosthecobacter sp.]|uniref:hypothetical protein n=1 Tax=Prosthecobacter sp. TaxID=1965333 RepID=UPI003783CE99